MSRARATALALVNWKGVFYERYLLDPHVTALEGANGAGKTTVLIAAYVVLLPDMSRLRFTNVGETGATGGDRGLWGRLGEPGRPSYSAMEIALSDGTSLVAGVHLERKGEPSVALTPFVVSDLNLDGRLREILLVTDGQHDTVPELGEVRASVEAAGGRIDVFETAKEYFGRLFELGVLPLRMATDEDRNKYAEMLRTSMTGGISRVLATELRSFLLKEETGLGDALSRMRANLDTCHRTRLEVTDAGRLEREIRGVLEAGVAMGSAAMRAVRAAAEEARARTETSRASLEKACRLESALDGEISEAETAHRASSERLEVARKALDVALAWRDRTRKARAYASRLAEIDSNLARAVDAAGSADVTRAEAVARRTLRRAECDAAREAYDRAARGVADWQTGLEELHRSAHEYRLAHRALERAREVLPELTETGIEAALESVRSRIVEIDRERARLDADSRSAAIQREEFDRARAALVSLAAEVEPGREYEQAREALARAVELDAIARRATELAEETSQAQRLAEQQARVRSRAAELGLHEWAGTAVVAVEQRLGDADAAVRAAEEEARLADEDRVHQQSVLDDVRRRRLELDRASDRWSEAAALVERIEAAAGGKVHSSEDLAEVRARIARDREAAHRARHDLQNRREERLRSADALAGAGPPGHGDLSRLRDELGGEFLVARFEDVDPEQARLIEAELGPLVDAIVVADPDAAARALSGRARELETVRLLATDERLGEGLDAPTVHGADVWVSEPYGLRVTRLPARSTLGRRARLARAVALRAEADVLEGALVDATEKLRAADALANDLDRISPDMLGLRSVDFPGARAELDAVGAKAETAERESATRAERAREQARSARTQVDSWRSLLGEAFLLGAPDHATRATGLARALEQAVAAIAELRRTERSRHVLAEGVEALRTAPAIGDALERREARRATSEGERARLFGAMEALELLVELRHALLRPDAQAALSAGSALLPSLEAQLGHARANLLATEQALVSAEAEWETATMSAQATAALRDAAATERARVLAEFDGLGVRGASEVECAAAQAAVVERDHDRVALEQEERERATQVALVRERRSRAAAHTISARAALADDEVVARPEAERWTQMRARATAAGMLGFAGAETLVDPGFGRAAVALESEVRSRAEVLLDRLSGARGGEECGHAVRALMRSPGRSPCDVAVDGWMLVTAWLRDRLPGQVADVSEPLGALDRLRSDLGLLEERLARQERELRGASEDVARGIDVQLRRAAHQVHRLNRRLEGLSFGAVAGIRVQLRRIDRMQQVLGALRDGAVQELLFDPSMPIEQALAEIFKRYGAGRTGGSAKILDYREYIELAVEIRRRTTGPWEPAHPTRLSTGEAIGVGAALMMVVLTEWEHDATLLRSRRVDGSLCLLFLDEANRLSQDNLGVLFDLCRNLGLQLLIAAPEVARAEGNTTYRLVRAVTSDGQDEVLVTGRRIR